MECQIIARENGMAWARFRDGTDRWYPVGRFERIPFRGEFNRLK